MRIFVYVGKAKLRMGQQQQWRLASMNQVKEAIETIEEKARNKPPCLTENCQEDAKAVIKLLHPVRRLIGEPAFRELKRKVLDKPAVTLKASVPLNSFRIASKKAKVCHWFPATEKSFFKIISGYLKVVKSTGETCARSCCFNFKKCGYKELILQGVFVLRPPYAVAPADAAVAEGARRCSSKYHFNVIKNCTGPRDKVNRDILF